MRDARDCRLKQTYSGTGYYITQWQEILSKASGSTDYDTEWDDTEVLFEDDERLIEQ